MTMMIALQRRDLEENVRIIDCPTGSIAGTGIIGDPVRQTPQLLNDQSMAVPVDDICLLILFVVTKSFSLLGLTAI